MEEFSPKTAERRRGSPALGIRADDRDDAQGRARGPPGLPGQRQGAPGRAEQAQLLRAQGGAHERRREVPIDAPRPRRHLRARGGAQGRARPTTGIESRVMSMYARGMSQRDIAATVREIYGFSMSAETVSAITDLRVWEELERWRSRRWSAVYAFIRRLPLRAGEAQARRAQRGGLRDDRLRPGRAQRTCSGCGCRRPRRAPCLDGRVRRAAPARRRRRAVRHMDGVSGLADGLRAIFRDAVARRCLVHLVRNSCKYVPSRTCRRSARDARPSTARRRFPRAGRRSPTSLELRAWARYRARWRRWGALDGRGRAAVLLRPRRPGRVMYHQRRRA